jgi:hypothetical protein
MVLPFGDSSCVYEFSHCQITVYRYAPCEGGSSSVVSFRVGGFPDCQYTTVGACAAVGFYQQIPIPGGHIDEYFISC